MQTDQTDCISILLFVTMACVQSTIRKAYTLAHCRLFNSVNMNGAVSSKASLLHLQQSSHLQAGTAYQIRPLHGISGPVDHSSSLFNTCRSVKPGVQERQSHSKSEGDKQFIEFLAKEIVSEKQESRKPPVINGFDDIETRGPHVKFVRKIDGEIVSVKFNVNDSVATEQDDVLQDTDEAPLPEMESLPEFEVVIEKTGMPSKLSVKCQLIGDSQKTSADEEEEEDQFEILELAMVEGGEWDENTYFVNSQLLDGNMYDMLMLMLEERGINHSTFCKDLIEFSTEYEHSLYVNLLESLQTFVQK